MSKKNLFPKVTNKDIASFQSLKKPKLKKIFF